MPSSIGYASAISRRTEEACSVSPTPTNSSFGEGSADSKDFREFSIRSWSRDSRSDSAMDRHSESSESLDNHSTSSGHGRHLHDFSTEFIPTRSTKLTAPKPAYNPMQFVKTGPAKLCETARVQMQKAVEVKKVREVKKEEAEDWQANLEGWKSSRRKRQEHVIERVTEVKRIEQEEALRAADAAAKKNKTFTEMMGKRGSRSRLLALYSTDESEESDVVTNGQREESSQSNGPPAEENKPECRTDAKDALEDTEYTYDKAIADYVKFTSAALSKTPTPLDEEPAEKRPESRTTNSNDNIMETAHVPTVLRRSRKVEQTLVNLQAATDSISVPEKQTTNVSESVEVVAEVSKRRSFFESVASLEAKESEANKLTHRKSGDFSSSFKSRLAAFAGAENAEGNKRSPSPVRDPEFRQKLSAFQGATAESKPETATKSHQRVKQEVSNGFTSQSQLEKTTITTAEEKTIIQNDTFQQATVISQSVTVDQQQASMENFLEETKQQLNESEKQPESHLAPQSNSSGESDFTEDEGIRSLSPRGTDSPGSPVETSQPVTEIIRNFSAFHFSEKETIITKALPTVEKQPIEFKQKEIPLAKAPPTVEREPIDFVQRENPTNKIPPVYRKQPIAVSLSKVTAAEPQQPAAFTGEVWDASNWLMISNVSNVAPPIEKPPPPPPDDDTDAPTQPDDDVSKNVATESGSLKKIRTELRKRRSDFLGIDVQAENRIFLEEDGEVPPPPDLKSLLREAEFRTSDLRMYADDIVIEDRYVEKYYTDATEEDELARVEREIIESLEKEEMERQKGGNDELDDYLTEGLNKLETSYDEDSAAIRCNMALLDTLAPQASRSKALPKAEETNKDNFMAESVNPAQVLTEKARPPPIPAKPSKLSAAPKPRLHDGESWMAKRKAAVEGPRKEKDVSRHWLIQEAEQRRITELQERSQPPSHWGSMPSVAQPLAPSPANHEWLSRSSSSTSMDKLTQPMASNSLNPSPHLYSNQQEILEYADFTQAPETSGQIWQVRSLNTGSIDHLQKLVKEEKMTLQHSKSVSHLASQKEPAGRSTLPPEIAKEPIAPLPDSVINTLTQRVAQRSANYADYMNIQDALPPKAAPQVPPSRNKHAPLAPSQSAPSLGGVIQSGSYSVSGSANQSQEKLINVSGKKKCSLCNEPLGRGAAMIIESLRLFYHITCFRCCVCGMALGNGTSGTDVRVRNNHLHCHDCYSNDEGLKFSKV